MIYNIFIKYTLEDSTGKILDSKQLEFDLLDPKSGKPLGKVSRQYNHKFDPIKVYNEEMLKLRDFAPKPIKSAKAAGI